MKYLVYTLLVIIFASCGTTRDRISSSAEINSPSSSAIDSSLLTWEEVFNRPVRQDSYGEVKWIPGENAFLKYEIGEGGIQVVRYQAENLNREVFISSKDLTPAGLLTPLRPANLIFSEDKSKVLVFTNTKRVWRQNTKGDYWLLDLKTRSLHQMGGGLPESSLMFAKFNSSGSKVAYVSEHNLYVEDVESAEKTQLTTSGTEDIINGTFDWAYEEELFCKDGFRWSPDNQHIAFWQIDASEIGDYLMINNTDSIYPFTIPVEYPKAGNDPSSARIGVVDISTKQIQWVPIPGDPKQNYLPRLQWLADHEMLIQQLNRHQNQLTLWKYNFLNRELGQFYQETDEAWVDILNMDASMPWEMLDLPHDGKAVYRLTEKDGWRHLYKLPLDGSDEILLTPGEFDVARNYGYHFDKGYAYVLASPDNPMQRYLYQVDLNMPSQVKRLTPQEYSGFNTYSMSSTGEYAIHTNSSANRPTNIHLIRLPDHEIITTLVTNEDYLEELQNTPQPKQEFFSVTTDDGITMEGRMYKPHDFDTNKQYPVIFYVYGEPAGQTAVDRWNGNQWITYLTQQGYIYITMDNRGSPSLKGREWRKSIYRNIGRINIQDQAMAARKVIQWPYIDKDRVSVWGWSGGGATTLNLLFQYPEIYQTGVAVAAVTNQLYYDNIYQERFMGLPAENMEDFIAGSPVTHAKNLEGNLLYIHGTHDDNVHYQNAEALINVLIEHDKQFEMMSYPGRSHGIWEGKNTTNHLYRKMTNFIKKHCSPGGMPTKKMPNRS